MRPRFFPTAQAELGHINVALRRMYPSTRRKTRKQRLPNLGAMRLLLVVGLTAGMALSALAGERYVFGIDANGKHWHGYTDSSGYFYGHDSNGDPFHAYTDCTGYTYGTDANGNHWHSYTDSSGYYFGTDANGDPFYGYIQH